MFIAILISCHFTCRLCVLLCSDISSFSWIGNCVSAQKLRFRWAVLATQLGNKTENKMAEVLWWLKSFSLRNWGCISDCVDTAVDSEDIQSPIFLFMFYYHKNHQFLEIKKNWENSKSYQKFSTFQTQQKNFEFLHKKIFPSVPSQLTYFNPRPWFPVSRQLVTVNM